MTDAISVPARKLRQMLSAVLPHALDGTAPPALCGVSFEMRAGTLFLAATDRYTIGIARERVPGAGSAGVPDQAAILPLEAARELRRMLKKQPGTAAIVIDDGRLTVDNGTVVSSWATAAGGPFPDWRKILHGPLAGTQEPLGDRTGVDPEMLARLTAVASRKREPLSIRFLVSSPRRADSPMPMVVATCGDWFLGAVMPVRDVVNLAAQWDDWASATAPAAPAGNDAPLPEAVSA